VDIPGQQELPATIVLPLPPPLPEVELHLVWDPVGQRIVLDPAYDPIPVSLDISEILPAFPCRVSANATGVLTPASSTVVNVLVEIMDLEMQAHCPPNRPNCFCILPNPLDPSCVISIDLPGKNVN